MRGNKDQLMSSGKDNWQTPMEFFLPLHRRWEFTLDPCADTQSPNRLCAKFFTEEQDGLAQSWRGERAFVNPPFSRVHSTKKKMGWIEKCYREVNEGGCKLVVLLIPARTDTIAFHTWLYKQAGVQLRFIKGRISFIDPVIGGQTDPAPFPSLVAVIQRRDW